MPPARYARPRFFVLLIVCALPLCASAAGPLFVAGTHDFNPSLAGTPITWTAGAVNYYTDRGPLSPTVSEQQADALLADAFSLWTSIPTAALTATRAGQLDEDVSGDNVTRWSSLPPDIQSTSAKPVAVIYDFGGQVIDALLGAGAGADCSANAVLVRHDAFTSDAHFQHALLILNGTCATTTAMPFLRYRLQRAVGRLLGLDWTQLNDNVVSGTPPATADDFAGFPVMHPDPKLCTLAACTPIAGRSAEAGYLPAMDDCAALSRLYPVTVAAEGKRIFRDTTARVHGVVRFSPWQGLPGQGMQGVNVVATRLDGEGNRITAVTMASVSGFLFRGNAGNVVTGTPLGEAGDRWGSTDPALQGAYDLSGLEIPAGAQSGRYELRLEAVNPAYADDRALGPYGPHTPLPSGMSPPVVITVTAGGEAIQDFVMQGSLAEPSDNREPHSFNEPASLPGGGIWSAALSSYGDVDWHSANLRPAGTFTIDVTALDENGAATESKALPVIGLWSQAAAESSPPDLQATYFNAGRTGVTRLQGSVAAEGDYKLALADYRGDGRPDYRYLARLLAIDQLEPSRAATSGLTVLSVRGTGFTPDVTASIAGATAELLSFSAERLMIVVPPAADGTHTLTLSDLATGATATAQVVYGSGADDRIAIIGRAAGPAVPLGAETEAPLRAIVTTPEGVPVSGATVTFTTTSTAVSLLPCVALTCVRTTDATGEASVSILVNSDTGANGATIVARLANGAEAYATVASRTMTVPALWTSPQAVNLPRGASAVVPLKVRLVSTAGVAQAGVGITFTRTAGVATLSATTATTDAKGEAAITITVSDLAAQVTVIARLSAGGGVYCPNLNIFPVDPTAQRLQLVRGNAQVTSGAFQPLVVRVVDSAAPPNLLPGVSVQFRVAAFDPAGETARSGSGDLSVGRFAQRTAVAAVDALTSTDAQGYASFTPAFAAEWKALNVEATAEIPGSALEFDLKRVPALVLSPSGNRMQSGEGEANTRRSNVPQ